MPTTPPPLPPPALPTLFELCALLVRGRNQPVQCYTGYAAFYTFVLGLIGVRGRQ